MIKLRFLKAVKPYFSLSEDELPEIRNWEINKIYNIELTIRQVTKRVEEEDDGDKKVYGDFEIISAREIEKPETKDLKETKKSVSKKEELEGSYRDR